MIKKCRLISASANDAKNDRNQEAEEDQGGDRKIKTAVLSFNADIAWQMADPVKPVVKKINEQACQEDQAANPHEELSSIGTHC